MGFRSPAYDLQLAQGAQFRQHQSWEIAWHFGAPHKEYDAMRGAAGALDLSYLGVIRATGRDRIRYLHSMLSNDIKKLSAGEGCYTTLLTNQGRMESDLYAYAFGEYLCLECPIDGKDRILRTLTKYLVGDSAELEDCSDKLGILSIQGPQSRERTQSYVGAVLGAMNPLEHRVIEPSDRNLIVVHRDRSGCDGYDLWLPRDEMGKAWNQLTGLEGIQPVGYESLNWLRTEAGIPWYGVDMDNRCLPLEFGLNTAISLNKGCYRGQEIMARITYRGHLNRQLGGIAVYQNDIPLRGTEVRARGIKIGEVTSAAFSPRLRGPLALAILKDDFRKPGTFVELSSDDGMVRGEVVSLPLP